MRRIVSLLVSVSIVCYGMPIVSVAHAAPQEVSQHPPLSELIEWSYVELFEKAPELKVPVPSIEAFREELDEQKDREEESLEDKKHSIERKIEESQRELKDLNRNPAQTSDVEVRRHDLHCRIQELRKELEQTKLALEKGIDNKYDNKLAKLQILAEWPPKYASLLEMLELNRAPDRKFGDFRDVGFRNGTFEGQQEDIRTGREAIEQMKSQNLLPPEVEDEEVNQYVKSLASRIARHSDLRIPLQVTVLKSEEINAFAIPGGFLFINTGLIQKVDSESQLAGVIAHETAHVAARHGHRLMTRANVAGIIYQAAQLAALILTGGVASIGTYYALQYGFYGLGLVLSLSLLGVSRDYEIEADILGTQYLWNTGYNTRGFISFFGKLAQEEGYITGLSWFRTHPPFYKRMEETFQEIVLMPEKKEPIETSSQFQRIQERLVKVMKEMEERDKDAPTLRVVYDCEKKS